MTGGTRLILVGRLFALLQRRVDACLTLKAWSYAVITGGATGIGRAAAKRFIEEGAFVFIFSIASKPAVRNLARTWAEDLKGTGIRVNVLSPGPTATELAKEASSDSSFMTASEVAVDGGLAQL